MNKLLFVLVAIVVFQGATILRQNKTIAAKEAEVQRLNTVVHVYGVELAKDDNQIVALKERLHDPRN